MVRRNYTAQSEETIRKGVSQHKQSPQHSRHNDRGAFGHDMINTMKTG
jgi:hypothetical protein